VLDHAQRSYDIEGAIVERKSEARPLNNGDRPPGSSRRFQAGMRRRVEQVDPYAPAFRVRAQLGQ
jgi:hypothetical protein